MSDDLAALLLALATKNAELRQQLATAQDMLMETAVDAGNLNERLEAVQIECDAWRVEAERLSTASGSVSAPSIADHRSMMGQAFA